MTNDDLEELALYIAESREHLATIEVDLLAIEAAGANLDDLLINKVFRAAHSIKGGAGFFGLKKIQELAHKVENVLDLVRSQKIIPNPEVVNILLLSFDRLRELVNNYGESNQADISEYVIALTGLATSFLPENQKSSVQKMVTIPSPSRGGRGLQISAFDLERAREREEYVYLVEVDLIHDVQRRGKTPWDAFREYLACGTILECEFNFEAVGTLDDEECNQLPLEILFASVIDPSFIGSLFDGLPAEKIHTIQGPLHPQALLKDQNAVPLAPPEAPAPHAELPTIGLAVERLGVLAPAAEKAAHPSDVQAAASEDTLRVNVNLLENLMNLAGELVLSRNQMQEALQRGDLRALRVSGQRISLVTSELQDAIMLTRLQPIGNILNKFPRVVRDLARQRDKDVQLEIIGREVELDKTLIEGLNDPLTHMVRNAVDHGIETREQRLALGKPVAGKIALRAYHAAGHVVVEVSDDGKGIDPQKVAQAAVAKGLVTEEQAHLMSDQEKMALIFMPGLSTAEKITDVSGRGVGMDVVKTNLDRLNGKVEIESAPRQGTTFRITLPLTLAIIPSLLVSINEERFAIPQINVSELIHVPAAQVKERIEVVGEAEVLVLRGKLIPIVRLTDLLGVEERYIDPDSGQAKPNRRQRVSDRRSRRSGYFVSDPSGASTIKNGAAAEQRGSLPADRRQVPDRRQEVASDLNIVIVTAGTFEYGLIVEALHETIEIVVRPLGRHLKGCREYAGATVLGDGRVALILDAAGLAAKANLNSLTGSARAQELEQAQAVEAAQSQQAMLLFRNAPDEPCAIPLSMVERIEHVDQRQVELLGKRRAMQYRGQTLPLVTLSDAADVGELGAEAERVVIVMHRAGRQVGLLAALPVDVVETTANLDAYTHRQKGIAGSCIIGSQTTLVVQVDELMSAAGISEALPAPPPKIGRLAGKPTVLLVEDSDFFRTQVRKYLEAEGYSVLAAEDGQAAWELLREHAEAVQLVVTDIEMPRMNGLELARRIKAEPALAHLPVIALTSLADEADIAAGQAAGIDDYEIKLDKESLLNQARRMLAQSAAA